MADDPVDRWPEQLLRGPIHSDGCHFHNTEARTTIYVSRKRDVAILDEFIGPKR